MKKNQFSSITWITQVLFQIKAKIIATKNQIITLNKLVAPRIRLLVSFIIRKCLKCKHLMVIVRVQAIHFLSTPSLK